MHEGKYSKLAISNAALALESDQNPEDGLGWTTSFENRFGQYVGARYAISLNSGTSGLHAALLAAGVGPGDEVISPALTVVMDAFATIYCGATPVFVDVERETWNIDPSKVRGLITDKTKAIISVSWFGLETNLQELRKIADENNLILIDDSAETILPEGLRTENWGEPHMRVFSFESKKHMSTGGEGGMVTTDSEELATRLRKASGIGYKHLSASQGRTSLASRVFQNPGYERFDTLGYNYRMTPVTAAIGLGQLQELDSKLEARREYGRLFGEAIEGVDWLESQIVPAGSSHSYYTFGLLYLGDERRGVSWQEFYDRFTAMGGDGFYGNCKIPYLEPVFQSGELSHYGYKVGLCPTAEYLQPRIMAFKTNYHDRQRAADNARILSDLVSSIGR